MIDASPERALAEIAGWLAARRVPFALVGGLAVSIRGEVRFTRDVDLALSLSEQQLESLVRDLRAGGYGIGALVEYETAGRTATVRMVTRAAVNVDLIVATCGIEPEIVGRATPVEFPGVGMLPVASAEDLLIMKVLAFTDRRRHDLADAVGLVLATATLDLAAVRAGLALVRARGSDRGQDLDAKLARVLDEAALDRASS